MNVRGGRNIFYHLMIGAVYPRINGVFPGKSRRIPEDVKPSVPESLDSGFWSVSLLRHVGVFS